MSDAAFQKVMKQSFTVVLVFVALATIVILLRLSAVDRQTERRLDAIEKRLDAIGEQTLFSAQTLHTFRWELEQARSYENASLVNEGDE